MKYFYLGFILFLSAILIVSCAGSIPEPAQEQVQWASAKWPGTGMKELSEGRELYISKCSGCHSLKGPSNYTMDEWKVFLGKMKNKAKLNDTEHEKIWYYLASMSKK